MLFRSVIGKVPGAGNSNGVIDYYFVDRNPLQGISYYRLKQTDFDGKFTYSDWVVVDSKCFTNPESQQIFKEAGFDVVSVYPNPTNGALNVSVINYSDQLMSYEVFDIMGKKHIAGSLSAMQGENKIALNLSNLNPGTYILLLRSDKTVKQFKVVKH